MNYKLAHIGVNCDNTEEAEKAAVFCRMLFGWETHDNAASVYAGTEIEFLKQPGCGRNGHIGISVPDVEVAVHELKERGFSFIEGSEKYLPDGTLRLIYLKDEIMGFAIHLTVTQ